MSISFIFYCFRGNKNPFSWLNNARLHIYEQTFSTCFWWFINIIALSLSLLFIFLSALFAHIVFAERMEPVWILLFALRIWNVICNFWKTFRKWKGMKRSEWRKLYFKQYFNNRLQSPHFRVHKTIDVRRPNEEESRSKLRAFLYVNVWYRCWRNPCPCCYGADMLFYFPFCKNLENWLHTIHATRVACESQTPTPLKKWKDNNKREIYLFCMFWYSKNLFVLFFGGCMFFSCHIYISPTIHIWPGLVWFDRIYTHQHIARCNLTFLNKHSGIMYADWIDKTTEMPTKPINIHRWRHPNDAILSWNIFTVMNTQERKTACNPYGGRCCRCLRCLLAADSGKYFHFS